MGNRLDDGEGDADTGELHTIGDRIDDLAHSTDLPESAGSETVEELTERQRTLLIEIARGSSNAQIATTLQLSVGIVKQYVSAVLSALGVGNRVHAAIIAYEAGLLDPDR